MKPDRYTLEVKKDPDSNDLIIEFPDAMMEETGWKVGDTLEWVDNFDGSWTLRKHQEHSKHYYDTDRNR